MNAPSYPTQDPTATPAVPNKIPRASPEIRARRATDGSVRIERGDWLVFVFASQRPGDELPAEGAQICVDLAARQREGVKAVQIQRARYLGNDSVPS